MAKSNAQEHEFEEIKPKAQIDSQHLGLSDIDAVVLSVSADLGATKLLVRDILQLKHGSIVRLDKLAGELTDITVNGMPLARGEVVVIGDSIHVRIAEIIGVSELHEE